MFNVPTHVLAVIAALWRFPNSSGYNGDGILDLVAGLKYVHSGNS